MQAVIAHQHLEEPHRQTQCVALYPALHPAFLALPLLTAVLKTYLRPSVIQKRIRLLQIHRKWELHKGLQRQRQWQLQQQAVSTPPSIVSVSHSIPQLGYTDMMSLVIATVRVLELNMGNQWLFMNASDTEMVSYATWGVVKALAEALHWQIIEKYWNTTMQQNNIWSIAFKVRTKEILKEVGWCYGPRWIIYAQTCIRFEHKSIRLNPILFNQQGTTLQNFMISTALNPPPCILNSLISFWQTISIFFL